MTPTGSPTPESLERVAAELRRHYMANGGPPEAADGLGIQPQSLGNIERGTVPASEDLLGRMADVYRATRLQVVRAYKAGRREFVVREGL